MMIKKLKWKKNKKKEKEIGILPLEIWMMVGENLEPSTIFSNHLLFFHHRSSS